MVAGLALLRRGLIDTTGLPLARLRSQRPQLFSRLGLADYDQIVVAGWDIYSSDLLSAARSHSVLPLEQLNAVSDELSRHRPLPAVVTPQFCPDALRPEKVRAIQSHRQAIEQIKSDLESFRREQQLDGLVMMNLSSTEAPPEDQECFACRDALERAIDDNDRCISASVLYAYAAISSGTAHVNFTPTRVTDWPAMLALAKEHRVPICGRDGKTGQTFLKTVLAPALRDRNLRVAGWFSTNLLGNRDGLVLSDPKALQSKLTTKSDVLATILGSEVEDHQVHIHFYGPRGDAKEAWDNIDIEGFANQRMQLKLNFLCRDSILAAPLCIELGRLADLAQLRGLAGPVEQLGVFFKSPTTAQDAGVEHSFSLQQSAFEAWLFAAEA